MPQADPICEITVLASLITSAVQDVVREYSNAGHILPSLNSTQPGPLDAPHLYEEPACLLVVTSAKSILLGKPDGMPLIELAKQTGIDSGKLGRILRMLAMKHCFKEVKPDVFANNRLSMQLVSTNPVSVLVGHMTASSTSPHDTHTIAGLILPPQRFVQAMVGWGEIYAWGRVSKDAVICDVGGGNGHATLCLMKEFPHLKVVLQDTPVYWNAQYPQTVEKQRVHFAPIDFFVDEPVPKCDFYYAMDNGSHLLIHAFVLQHTVRDSTNSSLEQVPEPLLANYGMGKIRLYQQDINMMTLVSSKERTLEEFVNLAKQGGFRFEHLWDSGEAGLLEFSVA
ncbi:hypothetical protein CPB84DRAFT_1816858 [Gymnopilus junonius]|uniref:O-methyltransferase C-terminal domain-containing protein n=1 Tax=Gymnopilus junonius TaxID=109634 RepID=A0A9P5NFW5_GYMJU|nr:hypothetical protein CPB84DRAFT_1816858 [Gymnopilus junonius]